MRATLTAMRPGQARYNLRLGPAISFRLNLRVLGICAALFFVVVGLAAWAATLGSFPVPLREVVRSTFGESTKQFEFIVQELRLPRILSAIFVGAALASSGAIFQGLVRNPLVSPDIIGIQAGATIVAVWLIVNGFSAISVPAGAFGGSVVAAAVIYFLAWKGGVSGNRLVLVGIGIDALLAAGTRFLIVRFPVQQAQAALAWSTGTVYGASWLDVLIMAGTLVVLLPVAMVLTWHLRVLQFGDDVAYVLGMRVEPTRLTLILVGCALAAVAVAVAGPVGFVALMVPHIARMVGGPMTGSTLLLTALLGATLLLGADMVALHVLPVPLPVGVVTAGVGAPYFLFLLYRGNVRL
jgi:iron complex transport system permease protein